MRLTLRERRSLFALTVGTLLVVVAMLLVDRNTPTPTNAGSLPVVISGSVMAQTSASTPRAAAPSSVRPTPSRAGVPAGRPSTTARPAAPIPGTASPIPGTAGAPVTPALLHLPTLGVTAPVDPVVSNHGVLQVPEDVSHVGWWHSSAAAGSSAGSTVLDGHIDSAVAGEGALFHLAQLNPGDPVAVTTSTGATVRYQVQARRVYVKERGLPAEVFDQRGPGRLVLISCGGAFDSQARSYQDNIVVFAAPIG